jgi:UDP-galactopyranose mutase
MKIRIHADRRVLSGSPTDIVKQMRDLAFAAQGLSLTEYTDWAAKMAHDMLGVDLELDGDTDDTRAASLVQAMVQTGLADELAEEFVN